ncbi:MAG: NUDIX hydrolase [Alphaproteobacteria bacterium]
MTIYNDILAHKPFDNEEAEYKKSFIQFLETFPKEKWGVRENLIGHLTPTAWIVNKDRTKVLMAFHNIYQSWAWLGGHSDGDLDCLAVAKKEVNEESGLTNFKTLSEKPFDLSVIIVAPHEKKGKFIADHIHYNPVYLFEADENAKIRNLPEENSAIEWIPVENVLSRVNEGHIKNTYKRIMKKVERLN